MIKLRERATRDELAPLEALGRELPTYEEVYTERFGEPPGPVPRETKRYVGIRINDIRRPTVDTIVLVLDEREVRLLNPITFHPPFGFDWGTLGANSRDLALAMLHDTAGAIQAWTHFIDFTRERISQIDSDQFVIYASEIAEWIASKKAAAESAAG